MFLLDPVCSSECNTNAVCTYYENRGDSCCKCADGFEGNGVNCFKKGNFKEKRS